MLNIEKGRGNKPIRMESNIIIDAGIRVGAIRDLYALIVDENVRESSKNSAKTITQGVPG